MSAIARLDRAAERLAWWSDQVRMARELGMTAAVSAWEPHLAWWRAAHRAALRRVKGIS
jgi:hypothetical protein